MVKADLDAYLEKWYSCAALVEETWPSRSMRGPLGLRHVLVLDGA